MLRFKGALCKKNFQIFLEHIYDKQAHHLEELLKACAILKLIVCF